MKAWAQEAIEELYQLLPDFGKQLALDGKIIETYASPYGQKKRKDKRADLEADITVKEKHHKNGSVTTAVFYGYRCHLLVDATYELPIAWQVTPASTGEPTVAKAMIQSLSPTVLNRARYLMADRGYSGLPLQDLIEDAGIIPIIDNPHRWKGDKTRQYLDTDLIYNEAGQVWWVDESGQSHELLYKGYDKSCDKSCDSLRFGFHPKHQDGRIFRLKRSVEPLSSVKLHVQVINLSNFTRSGAVLSGSMVAWIGIFALKTIPSVDWVRWPWQLA